VRTLLPLGRGVNRRRGHARVEHLAAARMAKDTSGCQKTGNWPRSLIGYRCERRVVIDVDGNRPKSTMRRQRGQPSILRFFCRSCWSWFGGGAGGHGRTLWPPVRRRVEGERARGRNELVSIDYSQCRSRHVLAWMAWLQWGVRGRKWRRSLAHAGSPEPTDVVFWWQRLGRAHPLPILAALHCALAALV